MAVGSRMCYIVPSESLLHLVWTSCGVRILEDDLSQFLKSSIAELLTPF